MSCPDCRTHIAEVNRLRGIIADQDQRYIRALAREAETNEKLRYYLGRLTDSLALFNGGAS